jgi:hypothetical protein
MNPDTGICISILWSVTMSCCGCQTENYRAVSKAKHSILQLTENLQYSFSYIITDGLKYLINKTEHPASYKINKTKFITA